MKTEAPAPPQTAQQNSFFRQSGWLMIANIAGGVFMWAVHLLNRFLPGGEYGSFGTYLAVVMVLPTIPLQMVVTQQTAKALANQTEGQLSGFLRASWWVISTVWLVAAAVVLVFQQAILQRWHMTDPVGLWVTLPVVLFSLYTPLFWGALQGRQNFLWLGWSMMSNGIVRLLVGALLVVAFKAGAGGMMAGVLLGYAFATALAAWPTRDLWFRRPEAFDWQGVLRQIVPLGLAFLGFQIMFTADTLFAKAYFDQTSMDHYVCAGTLARALLWLVLPLAAVMFPRMVHSAARGQKSNLMGLVLAGTAVLAVVGAAGLTVLGPWVVSFVSHGNPGYVAAVPGLLPWYAGAIVPLALANVLLNNLLARPTSKWGLAIAVLLVGGIYLCGLTQFHHSPISVLKTMAAGNLLLLGVCGLFTWRSQLQVQG